MWHILSFIVGAILGSFSNVVIYRLPRENLKIWNPPRSFCPNCGHILSWKDNIPILSYVFLKGRCRYCGWRIPMRYFIVEVLNATFYGVTSFLTSDLIILFSLWGLFSVLVIISFIDLETMMISDSLNILVFLFSLLISLKIGYLVQGLITAVVIFSVFFLIAKISRGFGMGDVLLLSGASVSMEPIPLNVAILVAAATALLYSVIKNRGIALKAAVPFAPFISIGIIVGVLQTMYTRGVFSW